MARVAIVTDTSSDLPPQEAQAARIRLVPLTVSFGDETFEAVTELSNEEFYKRLTAPGAPFPRTAAPNPSAFETAYRAALDDGAAAVLCITISERLSATHAAAVQAAGSFEPGRVEVLDSMTTTHALGHIARSAAASAGEGASLDEVVAQGRDLRRRSQVFFVADTLEYLRKGGRIGRAAELLGMALSIKPILKLEDGVVAPADRRRTMSKAKARLLELVADRPVEHAVVLHTMTSGIDALRDEVAAAIGLGPDAVEIGLAGPVAGSHVGPGMVGVCLVGAA